MLGGRIARQIQCLLLLLLEDTIAPWEMAGQSYANDRGKNMRNGAEKYKKNHQMPVNNQG